MKRRKFIKKTVIGSAAAFSIPYILPTGRLFAQTGNRLADHVVLVAFAGGVRQQESILKRYLDDSQENAPFPGNILYNLLEGETPMELNPNEKIVYGTTDGYIEGVIPIDKILNVSLQKQGLLFNEVNSSFVGHYGGLNTILTGNYLYAQGLRNKPSMPTIFEYLRRHTGEKATKTWFVGNGIGNSIPLLDYSTHPEYGSQYGANFLCPNITFGDDGEKHLKNAKIYHPDEELKPMYKMKYFLDNVWYSQGKTLPSIGNTEEEKAEIKQFIKDMFDKKEANPDLKTWNSFPDVVDSSDLSNVGWACEVMKRFKPRLTVVNLSNVDSCHSDFTNYLQSLHRADHATGHLWNFINSGAIPEMAGNTAIIVIPEHGRDAVANGIIDGNEFKAYDHSDMNSRRIFGLMAGPDIPVGEETNNFDDRTNSIGDIVNVPSTIAEILGFKQELQDSGLIASKGRDSLLDLYYQSL